MAFLYLQIPVLGYYQIFVPASGFLCSTCAAVYWDSVVYMEN